MHKYAGRRANVELAGAVGGVRFRFRTGVCAGGGGPRRQGGNDHSLARRLAMMARRRLCRSCGSADGPAVGSPDGLPSACA